MKNYELIAELMNYPAGYEVKFRTILPAEDHEDYEDLEIVESINDIHTEAGIILLN